MSTVEDSFQIFIALPTNDVCTVKGLSREMFVYELKSRVELKAGIPGDIFNLFFMNAQLLDKETLKSYKLLKTRLYCLSQDGTELDQPV